MEHADGTVDIQKIVGNIDKLPTLPMVVTTLNDLIRNPNTAAGDIHAVISKDQALSARILKLVNSAFYGFSERISSVSHAIVILGFNTVRNVALTASVFEMFDTESESEAVFDLKAFWMHSLGVASCARHIASKIRMPAVEDVFIAGLLHDIGKVITYQHVHHKFVDIVKIVKERNVHIKIAEEEVLDGINHAQVGAWLATNWKLPSGLVNMIGFHHRPDLVDDAIIKPVSCVHLADILIRSLNVGSGGDSTIPAVAQRAWEALGFSEKDIDVILLAMEEELAGIESFVSEV